MNRDRPILRVLIHRHDGTINPLVVPFEALSRLYLFCHLGEMDAVAFEYYDEGEKTFVSDDVQFERFSALLSREGTMEIYECKEETEEEDYDIFDPVFPGDSSSSYFLQPHHFSTIRPLGEGASGTCHLAIDNTSGERVAIKSIAWSEEEFVMKQLKRELDALRKCQDSPNIVKLLGELREGPVKMLVFEFMDGGSLERYGILPPRVLSVVAFSLLDALTFMKQFKILHRDIKRANVLVSMAGEVKLCDMGMSRILPPNSSVADSYVGDNYYMPPERLMGLKYRVPSEVWGWAVLLCECAIGRHPFLQEGEWLPRDLMVIQGRIKEGQAFTKFIPHEYGEDLIQLLNANTHCNPCTRWDMLTLHRSPYITQSREVDRDEAADWFSDHPVNND